MMRLKRLRKQKKRNRVRVLKSTVLLLAIALLFTATSCGGPAATGRQTANQPAEDETTWKVGIFDLDLPPLFFTDTDGSLTGFEIDLVQEAAKRMGKEIEYVRVTDTYAEALNSGEVDVVWGNIPDTEENRELMLLTKPYLQTQQVAVVAKDSEIEGKADLEGQVFATVKWTPIDKMMKDHSLGISFTRISTSRDFQTTFDKLLDESVSVVLCDETMADYMLKDIDNAIVILPESIGEVKYAAAFRQEDSGTCEKAQTALDAIASDGTGQKLSQQWFGKNLIIN